MSGTPFELAPCDDAVVRRLQRDIPCSESMAWILARRGIGGADEARQWLDTTVHDAGSPVFHDPLLLGDMRAAVERIHFAIADGQQIVIHGDYDADGVCSTTLLVEALEALGGDVRAFLPSRFANGYGLKLDSVERFALDGARLLIVVDCGITAVEEIAQAVDHGVDVIVCDHHEPGPTLPPAIICSTRPSDYPFPHLCATAVAGKLVEALGAPYGDAQHELEAIATIADVVPLVGENRHIVRRGLRAIRRTGRPGLRALLSTCDLHATEVTADDVAFRVAPRINAVGRLGEADSAYELLRAEAEIADRVARHLDDTNTRRRRIESDIADAAVAQIEGWSAPERDAHAYVVSGDGWHEGVVGIVASRLVERYHRPVIVIGEQEPLSRGSGRSIDGADLHGLLARCSDLLVAWGGHRGAAGLTIERDRIPELRRTLANVAREAIAPEQLVPTERADVVLAGDELTMELAQELERLAPFGNGNSRPMILALGATIDQARAVGGDGTHLSCRVTVDERPVRAIGFRQAELLPQLQAHEWADLTGYLSINRFRGAETLQLEIRRIFEPLAESASTRGVCEVACSFACADRVPLESVMAAARIRGDVDPEQDIPPLEALLAAPTSVDVRHRGAPIGHIARLATAGRSVLVVCADVSRRRHLLESRLHPQRIGAATAVLASERCNPAAIGARLARLARHPGPQLGLCDYGALASTLSNRHARFDTIVLLDPPTSTIERDLVLACLGDRPLHLAFGAAEARFALEHRAAIVDARETLRTSWRTLKQHGTMSGDSLERTLFGAGEHLHSPSAIAIALRELERRDLAVLDLDAVRLAVAGA